MSTVKNTKNYLNNLLFSNIDKIQAGAFSAILKLTQTSRGETLDEYKIQVPKILKTHTTKLKLNVKNFKEEFNAPGMDLKQNYILSGKVSFTINNVDRRGNLKPVNRSRDFHIPLKSVSRKQLKNQNYINQLAEEYVQFNDEDGISYEESLGNVSSSGVSYTSSSGMGMSRVAMGAKKHSIKMLESADAVNVNEGECVIDYILYELAGKHGFKNITRQSLIKYFKGTVATTDQIISFSQQYDTLSIYAIDPLNNVFNKHVAADHRYSLCFVVNNNHLYPVLDANLKKSIALSGKIELNDYKFNVNYDDYQYIHDDNESVDETKKVILMREYQDSNNQEVDIYSKIKYAMTIERANGKSYIVDNVKFQNGRITAFMDPVTNVIYETTTDFVERKLIIDGLTIKYGQHLVKFENQSYTQISKLIFDNEFGTVAQLKSNLSDKIFDILNNNHIKPFCATISSDIEEDDFSMGFDVCKSYSSVLLNNAVDFPIFQQFDEIQPFNNSLKFVAGEYYIKKDNQIYGWYHIFPWLVSSQYCPIWN